MSGGVDTLASDIYPLDGLGMLFLTGWNSCLSSAQKRLDMFVVWGKKRHARATAFFTRRKAATAVTTQVTLPDLIPSSFTSLSNPPSLCLFHHC